MRGSLCLIAGSPAMRPVLATEPWSDSCHPRLVAIDTKQVTPITMEQAVQVYCLLSAQTSFPAHQRHECFETFGDQLSRPFRVDRVEAHYRPGR